MQEAISNNTRDATVERPSTISTGGHVSLFAGLGLGGTIDVTKLVAESPLAVFGKRSCTMRIVVEKFLQGLATNPVLVHFDEEDEALIADKLSKIGGFGNGHKLEFPAVFLAGSLLGGVAEVISAHIAGDLMPMLKEANVLWL